jgi:hypothetical protein
MCIELMLWRSATLEIMALICGGLPFCFCSASLGGGSEDAIVAPIIFQLSSNQVAVGLQWALRTDLLLLSCCAGGVLLGPDTAGSNIQAGGQTPTAPRSGKLHVLIPNHLYGDSKCHSAFVECFRVASILLPRSTIMQVCCMLQASNALWTPFPCKRSNALAR